MSTSTTPSGPPALGLEHGHVRWTRPKKVSPEDKQEHEELVSGYTPIRPRASTPPSPRSEATPSEPDEEWTSNYDNSDHESEDVAISSRGRALTQPLVGPEHKLITRAIARRRAGPSSADHSRSEDQKPSFNISEASTGTQIVGQNRERPSLNSLGVEASSSAMTSTTSGSKRPSVCAPVNFRRFDGHRDTFAMLNLPSQRAAPELPLAVAERLDNFIDCKTYQALRLTCHNWSDIMTAARPLRIPAVYRLPNEIIENIYGYSSPVDFNSARHTCRAWMVASLDMRMLKAKLQQMGYWQAANLDIESAKARGLSIHEEWVMSKRLATECSLSPIWTGNGLKPLAQGLGRAQVDGSNDRYSATASSIHGSGLSLSSIIDLSELGDGYAFATSNELPGTASHITVSVCGQFLMLVNGTVIYVYRIAPPKGSPSNHGGYLEAISSVVCPKRVLAVSMDTSAKRFAIAALMDDRMGMVCELTSIVSPSKRSSVSQVASSSWETASFRAAIRSSSGTGEQIVTEPAPSPQYQDSVTQLFLNLYRPTTSRYPSDKQSPCISRVPSTQSEPALTGILVENGPRSIYRSLCSNDDPPLSVAICPQRRCVAFGCASGIELHWVDALTGQDLNRWFPLTAPSDFLFFLPPRRAVDSTKKLRLISSAGGPGQRGGLRSRFKNFNSRIDWSLAPRGTLVTGQRYFSTGWRSENVDHYKAVPLSDGHHVLFLDPSSGDLCLGYDAPIGGPTKLTRAVTFKGPAHGESDTVPNTYAAGSELRWGIRVVVGYGDDVWLFSLPPDFITPEAQNQLKENEWGDWRQVVVVQTPDITDSEKCFPLPISGIKVGKVSGLVDVAIDSRPEHFTIWAFGSTGMAYSWQLSMDDSKLPRPRAIVQDGSVIELQDHDGDWVMRDAPNPEPPEFDGSSSLETRGNSRSRTPTGLTFSARDRIMHEPQGVLEIDLDDLDEGDWSGDGNVMHTSGTPTMTTRWSEDDEWDWDVNYLDIAAGSVQSGPGRHWTADEEFLGGSRLQVEIL